MRNIENLVDKLISGEITKCEFENFLQALDEPQSKDYINQYIQEKINTPASASEMGTDYNDLMDRLDLKIAKISHNPKRSIILKNTAIVQWAAILIFISMFCYYAYRQQWFISSPESNTGPFEYSKIELGNKKTFKIEELTIGERINFNGSILSLTKQGEIVITSDKSNQIESLPITLQTGVNDSYSIVLPDGTKAWLNAQSQIKFSSNFEGPTRLVESTGEVYFQVIPAKIADNKPFVVKSFSQKITVLGTSFNINAFNDKPIKTSLIEGKIQLETHDKSIILSPGQQAIYSQNTNQIDIRTFNQANVTDWKTGYFVFQDASIEDVLEKLSIWYGFNPQLPNIPINKSINGKIKRDTDLEAVFNSLEKISSLRFYIDENKNIRLRNQ